jgi:hypothetical protein
MSEEKISHITFVQKDHTQKNTQTKRKDGMSGLMCDACNTIQMGDNMITYRCVKCFDYDLCATCYRDGFVVHKHKDFTKMDAVDNKQRFKDHQYHVAKYTLSSLFFGFALGFCMSKILWK